MKDFINKNIKSILIIFIAVVVSIIGITLAYTTSDIGVNIATGNYNVVYTGTSTLPTSKLEPIIDSDLLLNNSASKIIKIEFSVKGANTNPNNKDIIYDVSLSNITMPRELRSEYLKWRLYKNSTQLSEGNFSNKFDKKENNRMLLTEIQQDLPKYSQKSDSYTLYIWLSESCTGEITTCTEDMDQAELTGKIISGEVRIELSTGSKKQLVREKQDPILTLNNLGLEKVEPESIYTEKDDYGTSYYFKGESENNYVKFAKNSDGKYMYWRIIRINGDGSIRLIYDGTKAYPNSAIKNGTNNAIDRAIGVSAFNSNYDNTDVGYMYGLTNIVDKQCNLDGEILNVTNENFCIETLGGTPVFIDNNINRCLKLINNKVTDEIFSYQNKDDCTNNGGKWTTNAYEAAHANVNDSTIKQVLDNWYKNNILNTGYHNYISDTLFCNDRLLTDGYGYGPVDDDYSSEYEEYSTEYAESSYGNTQGFVCPQKEDAFTVGDTIYGNGDLTYPVGLISGSEAYYIGADYEIESYLHKGVAYWTMSPTLGSAGGFMMSVLSHWEAEEQVPFHVDLEHYVVPVINLKAESIISGTGSVIDPYVVE